MLKRKKSKGQTSVEYTVVIIVVIGALVAMQNYMKRGIQGRWKESVDEMGDQYDPRATISDTRHTLNSVTTTVILATNGTSGGYWTQRTDDTTSDETKVGNTTVGAY